MKRVFKAFLLCLIFLFLSNYVQEVGAEYIPGTKCPVSPDKSLASICGVVKSSRPTRVVKIVNSEEIITYEAPEGVPGVTVSVYECDNQSPTCKISGKLGKLFSSTSTNKDGQFYLWARKMDTYIEPTNLLEYPKNVASKKRYLVFACGNTLVDIQTLPSFLDYTYITEEVSCEPWQIYTKPENRMSVLPKEDDLAQPGPLTSSNLLANQMGNDDWTTKCNTIYSKANNPAGYAAYCDITSGSYVNHLTERYTFKPQQSTTAPNGFAPINNNSPLPAFNFDIKLEDADPRYIYGEAGGEEQMKWANYLGDDMNLFDKGSFWSRDCHKKYEGDAIALKFCVDMGSPGGASTTEITNYTKKLYENTDFVVQNKLPNIPPKNEIRFYKELPSRQDITEFIQDPIDTAKFLGSQFSNCIGSVFLRRDMQESESTYIECIKFQKCNQTLSKNKSYLNILTTFGPGSRFASPTTFKDEYLSNVDLNTPICKIDPNDVNETPKVIGDIQPPWATDMIKPDKTKYIFDKTYWSPELIYYFGKNNVTAKYGLNFQNNNDSFYAGSGKSSVNEVPFETGSEAGWQPVAGGTNVMFPSGTDRPNNSLEAAVSISSSTAPNNFQNALTSILFSPLEDPLAEYKALLGFQIATLGPNAMRVGEFSKVNGVEVPEKPILTPDEDKTIISNILFKGNEDHHPITDSADTTNFNGTRTPTSAIYLTNTAKKRLEEIKIQKLRPNDIYDSYLSTQYGNGKLQLNTGSIDWDFIKLALGQVIDSLLNPSAENNKSFMDRKNAATIPLDNAEMRNDLHVDFTLSEENFVSAFPLPVYPSDLSTSDWGDDNACYPWNDIDIKDTCGTDNTESPDLISRTCRVYKCYKTEIHCDCNVITDKKGAVIDHTSNCGEPSVASGLACSRNERLVCAQNQKSCIDIDNGNDTDEEKDCLSNSYGGVYSDTEDDFANACDNATSSYDATIVVLDAPACMVQIAGPYTCGGTLTKDSELISKPAILPDNPRDQAGMGPKTVNSLVVASNLNRKAWQSPMEAEKTYSPLAFISADASVRAEHDDYDITKRKDTTGPGGDAQNASIFRSTFSVPQLTIDPEYNKINLHCNIDDDTNTFIPNVSKAKELGSIMGGDWECDVNQPPDPEIVDLNAYTIKHPVKNACKFNASDACLAEMYSTLYTNPQTREDLNFSPTFVKILNAAASRMNIPAPILMSYVAGIGKSYKYGYYFTKLGEEELDSASFPWYGALPGCDETNTAAVGVYDWLQGWFNVTREGDLKYITENSADGGKKVNDALDELAKDRYKTAARCNFLDSTFVIAAALKSARQRDFSSCSDWTWEDARQVLLRVAWGDNLEGQPDGNLLFGPNNDEMNTKKIFEACKNY